MTIHGIFCVYKPIQWTSNDVCNVKKIFIYENK